MIREAKPEDFLRIYEIINDAAMAYKGIIPDDRWHDPYMSCEELQEQIADGVKFYCYVDSGAVIGVMGLQDKVDVYLIRHAYVMTSGRNKGVGSTLIRAIIGSLDKPILIGTWAAAVWAIGFYEKHGFMLVDPEEKNRLLAKYWKVPERQVETSVVLADSMYRDSRHRA